jgi:nucleoid DNA-binding protein
VAKGGSVALADFGSFEAKWTKERLGRNPSTGEPVITPAYRSLGFTPSAGFKAGHQERHHHDRRPGQARRISLPPPPLGSP